MKIGTKISLSFFITAIIVTTIATPVFYLIGKSNLENTIFLHLVTTAESRTRHIETFLEMSKNSVVQLSKSVIFENMLRASKQDPDYSKIFDMATDRLKKTEKDMESVCEVFILNKNGKVIASSNKDNIGLDKSTDAYFLKGKAGPYIKDAYSCEITGENSIAISAPILDDKIKELLGSVISEVEMGALNKITIDRTGLGETGEIYLVNKDGYMITPSRFLEDTFLKLKVDTENVREAFEDVKEFGVKPHKHYPFIYTDYRGVKVLGVHDHIPQMQWILLAEIDEKEAMAPLGIIKVLAILAIVFIPLAVFLISIFIAKGITRPIHNLRRGVEIVGKGNLDYKIGTDTRDEVGELTRAFDKMTWDLKKSTTSINSLYKEITERKKAEEKIRETAEEWDRTFNAMSDLVFIVDKNHNIIKCNKAFTNVLKLKPEQIIGKKCYELLHKSDKPWPDCPFKKTKSDNKTHTVEVYDPNIGIPLLVTTSPIFDSEGKLEGAVHIAKDITELKKAEKEIRKAYEKLKESQEELIQAEKLAIIGQLATGMAHGINNPLSVISGEAEMLVKDSSKDKGTRDASKIITEQAKRIKSITEGLLGFSRKRGFVPKPLDVNNTIEKSLSLLSYQAKLENIEIIKEMEPDIPKILGNDNQIQEIFLCIMANAIQAMGDGGKLTIRSRYEKKAVIIEFKDTGEGMDKETLKEIFSPFFSTREKGTGLGLSIVDRIIKTHKGTIKVYSKLGKGSTFIVKLPVIEGKR